MFPSLGRCDSLFGVKVNRRRYINGVYLTIDQHFPPIRVPPLGPKLASGQFSEFRAVTRYRGELTILKFDDRRCYPANNYVARPDHSPTDNSHSRIVIQLKNPAERRCTSTY